MRPLVRPVVLALLSLGLLVLGAVPALADPALPSNYVSQVVGDVLHPAIDVRIEGGDSFFVLEVEPGTEVLVPGYSSDEDYSDWEQLEVYLRVLPDGTVQLNRNAEAYYTNAARFGASAPPQVGADVPPDWETVGSDGRVAWHDHRIHHMSPRPPEQVATDAAEPQRVKEWTVALVVDGDLVVAEGTLDYVAERSPALVGLLALLGLVAGGLLTRRDPRLTAGLLLAAGGLATALLLAANAGRAVGFEIATPPIALAGLGAVAPLLGSLVPTLKDGQRRGLLLLGGAAILAFGVLATGIADGLLGGPGEGFGNWWTNPTLPVDTAPEVLRAAIAVATGLGAGLLAAVLSDPSDDLAELEGLADAG